MTQRTTAGPARPARGTPAGRRTRLGAVADAFDAGARAASKHG